MSKIRSKDTKPELLVRKYLFAHGFRYRLHSKRLPGHPDMVLKRLHSVIMINGCFWHGHEGCRYFVMPKSRVDFWESKIKRNQERDVEDRARLTSMGWNVITIWECQLKPAVRQQTLQMLVRTLSQIELKLMKPVMYEMEEEPQRMVADESTF